jgi:plasmid stabilization system protein ParE
MRIRYLPHAFAELEAIHNYLSNRSLQSALRTTTAIRNSIVALVDFPEMGQPADHLNVRVLRSAHHSYRVYKGDEIQILHIRHSARKQPAAGEL